MSDGTFMISEKQDKILRIIVTGDGPPGGAFKPVDLDQLLERLAANGWKTTKDSMHFSIRALVRRELILKGSLERRRGRLRLTLLPTEQGKALITPAAASVTIVEPEGLSDLLNVLV